MQRTNFYTQGQQSLVSLLLTVWLMVGSNPNTTFAAPEAGPATVSAAASTSAGARPRADTAASIGTSVGATLIAQGGHRVTFLQNNGSWQAEVDENLPVGFSRKLHLPVYIEKGMHWQQLASFSEAIQRQRVAVDFTPGRGYVYIGSRGLRGGNAQSLHAAVDQGYLAQVRKILKKGKTNINAVNEQEQSALHRAVIKGHKEIAALLLEAGADTALQDHQGKRALDYADEDDRSYFSTIASVVQLFSTLDDLIAADLSAGGSQKQDEIEQKLSEVLSQLGELEAEETQGQEQYRHFKYRYHAFKISYYKALGNEARASSNEKLAEKYEEPNTTVLLPLPPDEEEQEALEAKITAKTDEARSSTEDAKRQEILGEIREDILPGSACAKIEALVAEACRAPGNFDGYIKISATRENFERRMHEAIVNCAAAQAGEQAQEIDRRRRKRLLAGLATLVHSAIDQNRLAFIQNALDCSEELRELFFTNLLLTEENISRRYGELTQEFHPDKAKWIPEAYQSTARDLMALITACRDGLMQNLQTAAAASGKYTFYQKQGDSFWAMAKDCRHAQKGEWDQLTRLLQADFDYLSEAALEKSKIENATRAYEAYRACCRLADEQKPTSLLNQIQLRGSMALYLYAAGRYLEAQLHALGAMRLIFAQTKRVNLQVLQDTQVILAKVQGQGNILPAGSTAQIIGNIMSSEPIQALITFGGSLEATTIESRCSWNDIARIRGAIQGDLSKIARKLILNSDPNLVKYQASEEDILRTSTQAVRYKVAGGATMAGGVLAGGLVFAGGVLNILQGAGVVAGATFGGPALAIVSGTIFIGLGIWGGVSLWQKGAILMKKPAICEKLNGMMQQALAYYNQGELQKFIAALAKEYATGKQLLSLGSFRYGVPAEEIITSLTEHGFRPDGIAYLFNLMGEAFNSGKVRIPGCLQSDLPSRAMYSFNGSLREELVESAAKLDERISEMRKKDRISIMQKCINTLRGFFMLRDEGYLAREHVEDAQEMPFKVILEEMRNVAKLNIAMIRILREWQVVGGEQAEINAAKKLLQEVRNTIDHYGQFHTMPALRLAAIEDFLWVVSGHTAAIKAPA